MQLFLFNNDIVINEYAQVMFINEGIEVGAESCLIIRGFNVYLNLLAKMQWQGMSQQDFF